MSLLDKILKKDDDILAGLEYQTEQIELADIIAPASVEISQSYLKLGERFAKTFFVFSYPRYLSTGWMSPAININYPLDISFHIHPVDSGRILRQLRKKLTEVQAELIERAEKGLIRDPTLETAYQDIETLRDALQRAEERVFRLGVYVTIYGDDQKELREIETKLRSIFESRLIYLKPTLMKEKQGFTTTAPYGLDQIMVHTPMNTAPLSSIFPFVSPDLSAHEGILYGINQHNNSLVLFDRFGLENANTVVFGKAGSGKSIDRATKVLCNNKGKIRLLEIGPLVEKTIKEQGIDFTDEELEGKTFPGLKVWTFDENMKTRWGEVKIAARKKAPKTFYKFRTRSGREITTTGDHNLVVLKNGKIVINKGSETGKGDFVPLTRSIEENPNPQKHLNLLELFRNSNDLYVTGVKDLIKENYRLLKDKGISNVSNDYLCFYKKGVAVPMQLFNKIMGSLEINPDDNRLKKLGICPRNRRRDGINIYFPINEDFLKIAGLITAEGYIPKKYITIGNTNKEIINSIKSSLEKLGLSFYVSKRKKDKNKKEFLTIVIQNVVFTKIVKKLKGGGKAGQKKVWPLIFGLKKESVAQYLSAYYEGDGGVNTEGKSVVASSKSKELISQLAYLLYYFGIIGRINKTKKRCPIAKRERSQWIIRISGHENLNRFAREINFISSRNKEKLSRIINGGSNTNVDFIPGIQTILTEIYQLFSPQLHNWKQFRDWKNGKKKPSPQELIKAINRVEEKIHYFKDLSATFKVLKKLPDLNTIIASGTNTSYINRELGQIFGTTWRTMKNQKFKPLSQTALGAIEVIDGNEYSLTDLKERIHLGFREMDLSSDYYHRVLEPQHIKRNTKYETIQKSAYYVWKNYEEMSNNIIPKIEERLNRLRLLANSNLFWDPIVEVKKIENKKDKYVYDLTCENGVFLAGEAGMFVHNSYFCKIEVLRYLMQGIPGIIIDPENEFQFLSDAVGGSYFNISLNSPHHLNPFDLPEPREDEQSEDVFRSNVINLVGLFRIMLGGLTPEEDGIIDKAINETYAAKDITPDSDPATWKDKIPLMSDFESVLSTMEGAESLLERVSKFTTGSYSEFFNNPSNVSMDKNLVVFGIRDMEDELRPMAMFIVLRYIWNSIRSELKKRILLVDEAWWIMQTEDGASFLYGICKRSRKYWLGVTTITQDVSDFMKSEYGKPIITNSSLQLLMKQHPATIDVVKKTFNLTDQEKYILMESDVGEGIFIAGQKRVALKVIASYAEDQIITSSPEEVKKIKQAKKQQSD